MLKIVIRVRRERYAGRVAIRWENPVPAGNEKWITTITIPGEDPALKMQKPRSSARFTRFNLKFSRPYRLVTKLFFNGDCRRRRFSPYISRSTEGFVLREGIPFNYQFHLRTFA